MKRLFLLLLGLLATCPASAEVCDKYSESWRPTDGPLDAWTLANSLPLFALTTALVLVFLLSRSRMMALASAALFAVPLILSFYFWLRPEFPTDNPVLAGAIREGCMSGNPTNDLIGAAMYGLLVASFLLMSWRWPRSQKEQPA